MAFSRTWLMSAAALAALGACTTVDASGPGAATQPAASGAYAGKSTLDAAIEAAGGEAALSKVQELYWTGTAKMTAADKVTELGVATIVYLLAGGDGHQFRADLGVEHVERMAEFVESADLHGPIVSNVSTPLRALALSPCRTYHEQEAEETGRERTFRGEDRDVRGTPAAGAAGMRICGGAASRASTSRISWRKSSPGRSRASSYPTASSWRCGTR